MRRIAVAFTMASLKPFILAVLPAILACSGDHSSPSDVVLHCPPNMARAAQQAVCIRDRCGDGTVDSDEACDDGNIIPGDGCSSDCGSTEVCGNRVVDTAVGEVCDDGNIDSGDGCCDDCRSCWKEVAQQQNSNAANTHSWVLDESSCSRGDLERLMAEVSKARSRARTESARAREAAGQAHAATLRARQLARASRAADLDQAHAIIADLERKIRDLRTQLDDERLEHLALSRRLRNGRSDKLD